MIHKNLDPIGNVRRVAMTPQALRKTIDDFRLDSVGYMGGSYGVYVPTLQTKYLDETHLREWPDAEGNVILMTPSEVARVELKRHFPGVRRIGWPKKMIALLDYRPPIAYLRPFRGSGYHYDLVGAYWQIYRRLWLDIGYPTGFGHLDLMPMATRLERDKLARNAIIGIIRARGTRFVKGRTHKILGSKNNYLSPPLWAQIQAILNEIAYTAIEFGAIYIATDGYIFPDMPAGDEYAFEKFLNAFGFSFRRAYGQVNIRGWGSYSTALKTTKLFSNGKIGGQKTFNSIKHVNPRKPLKQVIHFDKCLVYRDIMERISK